MCPIRRHIHAICLEKTREKCLNQENWIPGSEPGKKNEYEAKSWVTVRQVQWVVRARMLPLSFLSCTGGGSEVHPLRRRQMA